MNSVTHSIGDEKVYESELRTGALVSVKIPPGMIYRKVFLFLMANNILHAALDFEVKADVKFSRHGHEVGALPANILKDSSSNRSVKSAFTAFLATTGGASPDAGVLSVVNPFFNGQSTKDYNVILHPAYITIEADEAEVVCHGIDPGTALTQGIRAFIHVISSNNPWR